MSPELHTQYLDYLDRFSYFGRPGQARLSASEWESLAKELAELSDAPPPDVRRRRDHLRAALLQD